MSKIFYQPTRKAVSTRKKNKNKIKYHTVGTVSISNMMVFNATFNNISVISWRSVLLVEETGVRRENHRPVASRVGGFLRFLRFPLQ
jgi:uncharacterized DUF497 family protein